MGGVMFKNKEIILDAYTAIPTVYELYKPKLGTNSVPEWFKKLPSYKSSNEDKLKKLFDTKKNIFSSFNNMKYCSGVIELFKSEITIPMWSDYAINYSKEGMEWLTAAYYANAQTHPVQEEAEGWLTHQNTSHLKLVNPWYFKCNEDINFLLTNTDYFTNEEELFKYKVVNGIINFKKTNSANVNLLFPTPTQGESKVLLEAGNPVASLIPLSDRPVKINYNLVNDSELTKLRAKEISTCFFKKFIKQQK